MLWAYLEGHYGKPSSWRPLNWPPGLGEGQMPCGFKGTTARDQILHLSDWHDEKKMKFSGRGREVSMTASLSGSGTGADNGIAMCPGPL